MFHSFLSAPECDSFVKGGGGGAAAARMRSLVALTRTRTKPPSFLSPSLSGMKADAGGRGHVATRAARPLRHRLMGKL